MVKFQILLQKKFRIETLLLQETYRESCGASKLTRSTKDQFLQHLWREPSLSIHGIQGAFDQPGSKTVIPCKVTGKFSIRVVPDMTPEKVHAAVKAYLEKKWAKLGSDCQMEVIAEQGSKPWVANFNNTLYRAGARAQERGKAV